MSEADTGEITRDTLLGGRVRLAQPRGGFRAAIDPVLLAAAVPAGAGESALDAGAGTGAAALCLALRVPGVDVTGIEIDPALAALANENAAASGVADRVRFVAGDLLSPPAAGPAGKLFDHVLTNPPFSATGTGTSSACANKRRAKEEGAGGLAAWLDACLGFLKPGGTLTLIHRADRREDILAALSERAGGIVVFPLLPGAQAPNSNDPAASAAPGLLSLRPSPPGAQAPNSNDPAASAAPGLLSLRPSPPGAQAPNSNDPAASAAPGLLSLRPSPPGAGKAAKRIIVAARKGSTAPLETRPGLVLHRAGGGYTPEAEAILRAGGALPMS